MREVFDVARARDIALPDDAIERSMTFVGSLPSGGTASLQRDILQGRPSELASWNGAEAPDACHAMAGIFSVLHDMMLEPVWEPVADCIVGWPTEQGL